MVFPVETNFQIARVRVASRKKGGSGWHLSKWFKFI